MAKIIKNSRSIKNNSRSKSRTKSRTKSRSRRSVSKLYGGTNPKIGSIVLADTKKVRDVKHFWYRKWPDHGAPDLDNPKDKGIFIQFVDELIADMKLDPQYTVIHCSAGVGRTGTLYVILKLCEEKHMNLTELITQNTVTYENLKTIITNARELRNFIVQSVAQFIFLCKLFNLKNIITTEDKMTTDFNLFVNKNDFTIAKLPKNKTLNRYNNILPYDSNRIRLRVENGKSDYINASPLGNLYSSKIIASDCPVPVAKQQFLRMLDEYKIGRIVMLTGLTEGSKMKCDDYTEGDNSLSKLVIKNPDEDYGNVTQYSLYIDKSNSFNPPKYSLTDGIPFTSPTPIVKKGFFKKIFGKSTKKTVNNQPKNSTKKAETKSRGWFRRLISPKSSSYKISPVVSESIVNNPPSVNELIVNNPPSSSRRRSAWTNNNPPPRPSPPRPSPPHPPRPSYPPPHLLSPPPRPSYPPPHLLSPPPRPPPLLLEKNRSKEEKIMTDALTRLANFIRPLVQTSFCDCKIILLYIKSYLFKHQNLIDLQNKIIELIKQDPVPSTKEGISNENYDLIKNVLKILEILEINVGKFYVNAEKDPKIKIGSCSGIKLNEYLLNNKFYNILFDTENESDFNNIVNNICKIFGQGGKYIDTNDEYLNLNIFDKYLTIGNQNFGEFTENSF